MKTIGVLISFIFFITLTNAQPYVINQFDVRLRVAENGDLDVKEVISVNFNESRRGIFRVIPFRYKFNGKKYVTNISGINVPKYKTAISNEGPNKRIRIGDENVFITGPQTYEINYTVSRAIIAYEDGQEVYWNLTGDQWDTRIEKVNFEIQLPRGTEILPEHMKVFTGRPGSTASDGVIQKAGANLIRGFSTSVLNPGEGMTVAVKLPVAFLQGIPSHEELKPAGIDKEKNKPWYLAIPVLLWGILQQWWKRVRNRNRVASNVIPQTYPPDGMTSAHVGAYIDHRVNDRDVISLIPYWATEGFIQVMGMPDGDMVLIKNEELPRDFPKYEIDFFNKIFRGRDSISFSEAKHQFGADYFKVRRALVKEIESAGYYDPEYVKIFKSFPWPLICTGIIVAGALTIVFWGSLVIGIGLIVSGVGAMTFSFFTAPLSAHGQAVHDHLKGLELFMKRNDGEEIRSVLERDPGYFGKMLPFAVALGLDKQWLKTFERIYDVAPAWYIMPHYGHRPSFSDFSQHFEVKEITRAFTTFPESSSSGSSSFGGGGFSGGGFGGGGGGSW